jgi:hypothetical protein
MRGGVDGLRMRSRVKGRAAIVRSLHGLHRRVYRFATLRAGQPDDYRWALHVCGELQKLIAGEHVEDGRR